jgi:hypothetical protein
MWKRQKPVDYIERLADEQSTHPVEALSAEIFFSALRLDAEDLT